MYVEYFDQRPHKEGGTEAQVITPNNDMTIRFFKFSIFIFSLFI